MSGYTNMIQDRLQSKKVTRDKEGYCILIKVSIQEEDITVTSIYAPNNKSLKYMKQKFVEL